VERLTLLEMLQLIGHNPTKKFMREFCNDRTKFKFEHFCQVRV
jgi:predicted nucleic acid-binding OB-fold protein